MANVQSTPVSKIKKLWRRPTTFILALVFLFFALLQGSLDIHFWRTSQQYSSNEPLVSMIIQAIRAVNKPAVMDPTTKKVYLPDANLVLPPYPQNMPNIEYAYSPSVDSSDAEANVTVTNAVSVGISKILNAEGKGQQNHDPNAIFAAVPGAQACTRGVHVVFGTKTTYAHLQFTKKLSDGRTMHVYTEQQKCAYDLQPLVTYLRDAQSY